MDFSQRVVLGVDEVLSCFASLVVFFVGDPRGEVARLKAVLYRGQVHCVAQSVQMGWFLVLQMTFKLVPQTFKHGLDAIPVYIS